MAETFLHHVAVPVSEDLTDSNGRERPSGYGRERPSGCSLEDIAIAISDAFAVPQLFAAFHRV